MEQFLDYRQVPTATEANETNQEIRNGHAEEVKETMNNDETDEKGWYCSVWGIVQYGGPYLGDGRETILCEIFMNLLNLTD